MKETYSLNELLNSTFPECCILLEKVFINTENNEILGYFWAKYHSNIKYGGVVQFISHDGSRVRELRGNSFPKHMRILKIIN